MFNGTVFEVNDFSEEKQKKFNDFQSIVISRERVKKRKALEPKNSDDNVDTINTTYTNTEIKLTDE
ncbi:hypothetical protein DERP_013877 [Dermatophagoides pteronyssinus]|uniref:Uncharacterized protein n=1 Tax=Dermatophagoides pteronyssinus TaxID=6956 RepID=A0ABQ8J388_DERPT|nr:hypothetical protein DERP_013877 [Dermatophagoides pteronyssinus]